MKVSIIIPTIGRKTLLDVLESLLACDGFERISPEIVVVFDGKLPKISLPNHPAIKVLETGKKVYSGGARNFGLKKTMGDVIVFIGDDTLPDPRWLRKIYDFHVKHPEKTAGLLGKISWTPHLATDAFHQWLENNAQFDFETLEKEKPTWRHFYTSNISLKKELIGDERFSDQFVGWGFEDTEFGYRLAQKGLELMYDPTCEVFHDHEQKEDNVWKQTRNARKNALVFERLHPELQILPRGMKRFILNLLIGGTLPLTPFSKKVKWWRSWKKAWLGK